MSLHVFKFIHAVGEEGVVQVNINVEENNTSFSMQNGQGAVEPLGFFNHRVLFDMHDVWEYLE